MGEYLLKSDICLRYHDSGLEMNTIGPDMIHKSCTEVLE